jgi:hypothetical protein
MMTRRFTILLAASMLAIAGGAVAFTIRTQTIEASGARSTGGDYALTSVVGQPIVALSQPSTGGEYSLRSGFLAGFETDTPQPVNAPTGWVLE